MKAVLLFALRAYQLVISPMLGQNCRFYPTCSNYAMQAVALHGVCKGSLLAGKRLCKCHPWHAGGVDLVPEKESPANHVASEKPTSDPISIPGHPSNLS